MSLFSIYVCGYLELGNRTAFSKCKTKKTICFFRYCLHIYCHSFRKLLLGLPVQLKPGNVALSLLQLFWNTDGKQAERNMQINKLKFMEEQIQTAKYSISSLQWMNSLISNDNGKMSAATLWLWQYSKMWQCECCNYYYHYQSNDSYKSRQIICNINYFSITNSVIACDTNSVVFFGSCFVSTLFLIILNFKLHYFK